MLSYIDDFWLMLFLTLTVIPLLLLIRPPGAAKPSELQAHAAMD
jgi:DHA2 family multidrug resistance protein